MGESARRLPSGDPAPLQIPGAELRLRWGWRITGGRGVGIFALVYHPHLFLRAVKPRYGVTLEVIGSNL